MTKNKKDIRWKQRFKNLEKAYTQFQKILQMHDPSKLEEAGIIQTFEFTFELSWKTLKDYIESKGVSASFPRDVLKQAFHHGVLEDGDLWAEMLNKRNEMAHLYDEEKAVEAVKLIRKNFAPALAQVFDFFKKEMAK